MDRRQSPRVSVHFPAQVWGIDAFGQPFTSPVVVTNISTGGLVVQGVNRRIRIGELLDVRIANEKAQFRVVWIADAHMGLERITAQGFLSASVLAHCSQQPEPC
jgi:hypothetical protein